MQGTEDEGVSLAGWGATAGFCSTTIASALDRRIEELFEAQVALTPDAVALVCEDLHVSYAELNRKANQVAHALLAMELLPDGRVGLYAERGWEAIVGILGILKAGGAYVPLDPGYPAERLAYLVQDAAPIAILVQKNLANHLLSCGRPVLVVDEELRCSTENPRLPAMDSRNLAYIVYTSGSTGQPKGVMVEHRSVLRLVINASCAQIRPHDCVAHCASLSFDATTWEIWAPLLNGARLLVVPNRVVLEPALLTSVLLEYAVTAMWLTVGLFNEYVEFLSPIFGKLNHLLVGGDALNPSIIARVLRNKTPPNHLINGYGPTETTTFASMFEVREVTSLDRSIPIGQPIRETQIYILDSSCVPVPDGASGEIYIGGLGVARGYLNQPELTAERFVPDAFGADAGGRLFRSGDVGCRRVDGNIEYLGRNDTQIKIRGFRVEPGEIEAAMQSYPGIKQAVVIARKDHSGEKQLSGYVVADIPALKALQGDDLDKADSAVIADWKNLYEEMYSGGAPGPSFIGWNSSYTGAAIPEQQMREWLGSTVDRIRALEPKKVLEVGCGVGLLLQHLAADCVTYKGIDFSAEALARLQGWLKFQPHLANVELERASALQLNSSSSGLYDTVIINSVIQYFPDLDYLYAVLQKAARFVPAGGHIFIGDVRHFGLLQMFHNSIQLTKAPADLDLAQLKNLAKREFEQDKELVVDPEFFRGLPQIVHEIGDVQILLKRATSDNELTRYRYDVVLKIGDPSIPKSRDEIDWRVGEDSVAALSARVGASPRRSVRICGIPNRRLFRDIAATRLIETRESTLSVSGLRGLLEKLEPSGEDPEDFWKLGETLGYQVQVGWTPISAEGSFDVEWTIPSAASEQIETVSLKKTEGISSSVRAQRTVLSNDPRARGLKQQLTTRFREFLEARLPTYMVPTHLLILDDFPLTSNGKVDRRALPVPEGRSQLLQAYLAARTPTEETLSSIWKDVLSLEAVGIEDNFVQLGGNSLVGMKIAVRVSEQLGIRVPALSVFRSPTIKQMASLIDEMKLNGQTVRAPGRTQFEEGSV